MLQWKMVKFQCISVFCLKKEKQFNKSCFFVCFDTMFRNSLYMLVRMGNHVMKAEDTGSFLSKTYGNCLVMIKRNFDKFLVRFTWIRG
jgi:hypothetical protein